MTRTLETHGAAFATRVEAVADPHTLVQIGDALDTLAEVESDLAEIVELKFFCGFRDAYPIAVRPHAAARP